MPDETFVSPDELQRLTARDVMTPSPVTVGPETLLSKAMDLMLERGVQHFPVLKAERYVGMLSERDLHDGMPSVLTVSDPDARRRYLGITQVSQVMVQHPPMVSPDAPLAQVIASMRAHRLGAIAVVYAGRLAGIITAGDLITLLERILTSAERWPRQ